MKMWPTLAPGSPADTDADSGPTLDPGSPLAPNAFAHDQAGAAVSAVESAAESAAPPVPSVASFDDEETLRLSDAVLRGVYAAGFETPSRIQATATPALLQGRDVLAQAPSGTGRLRALTSPRAVRSSVEGGARPVGATGPLVWCAPRGMAPQTPAVARTRAVHGLTARADRRRADLRRGPRAGAGHRGGDARQTDRLVGRNGVSPAPSSSL